MCFNNLNEVKIYSKGYSKWDTPRNLFQVGFEWIHHIGYHCLSTALHSLIVEKSKFYKKVLLAIFSDENSQKRPLWLAIASTGPVEAIANHSGLF